MYRKISKTKLNKRIFIAVVHRKGDSIRSIGEILKSPSEKTIRRALNKGEMKTEFIEEIAKFVNVDIRYLTGQLCYKYHSLSKYLEAADYYTFDREKQEQQEAVFKGTFFKNIFYNFEIPYEKFDALDFYEQVEIYRSIITSLTNALNKYFNTSDELLYELECYIDDHKELEYADTVLRQQFLAEVPDGYTKEDIEHMSAEGLLDLDMSIQAQDDMDYESFWEKKYGI